jgi:ABC-type enterochelin transport system substrate-binding protein
MKLKSPMFAVCLLILTACASNHAKTTSGATSVSESQLFSADTKARLKTIQDDYHLMAILVQGHGIIICGGLMPTDQMDAMQKAIHEAVGKDYSINVIIK